MAKTEATALPYSIRKDGRAYVSSSLPGCGYNTQQLRQMQKAGFHLYKDGKRAKIGGGANG